MKLRGVNQHKFSMVPHAEIQRSVFNRTHNYKTTFDGGYLIPFLVDEALPGDSFRVNATIFARLNTPIVPVLDNMYLDVFYFSVPIRLVWSNFVRMMGEQPNPGDSTDFSVPQIVAPVSTGWDDHSLADYFGLPTHCAELEVSALWHRGYNLIWNCWFRDENIQDAVVVDTDDADSDTADYVLLRRGKRHDYFTSCLPWPQKGPSIALPLSGQAPVVGIAKTTQVWGSGYTGYETDNLVLQTYTNHSATMSNSGDDCFIVEGNTDHTPAIYADFTNATISSINELREAFQIQRLYERDARGGTRYPEILISHFGVTDPMHAVLQRPEYLGGSSHDVMIVPVAQTSESNTTPQGNLAGFGTVVARGTGFTKSFTEHCLIFGFLAVRADLTYQHTVDRMFSRSTRWDFYWPGLAHLGEQAVLNKEIYAQNNADDNEVFGYQERWAEYRYKPSKVTGRLRNFATGPLDIWHLSQNFTALPVLTDPTFIEDNPPIDRVIAVPSEPHFLMDSHIEMICARPMPVYSVPGLIDHF